MSQAKWDSVDDLKPIDANLEIENDSNTSKVSRMKNYIPKKYKSDQFSKIWKIAGVAVVVVLVIVIIILVFKSKDKSRSELVNHLNSDDSENSGSSKLPWNSNGLQKSSDSDIDVRKFSTTNKLILSNNKKLWSFDVKSKNLSPLHDFDENIGIFEVYNDKNIFWSDTNTSTVILSSFANQEDSKHMNFKVLLEEERFKPQSMAFDWIGENLYIVDEISEYLVVINIRTKRYDIILSELIRPHDIDLDPGQGVMFILQLHDSILKADMDGRSTEKIIFDTAISAITVDRKTHRIYWVNKIVGIEVCNYNGRKLGHLASDALNIIDLTIIDDQLFWLWQQNNGKLSTHHILSCRISNETCKGHEMQKINNITDFKSIRAVNYGYSNETNPCQINNGDCQHLCLVTSGGKSSCTCNLGWQLNPDEKTCREVNEFILYTYNGFFKSRILDTSRSVSLDVLWPTKYYSDEIEEIFFDYDRNQDDLYYSDGKKIFLTKLKGKCSRPSIIIGSDSSGLIHDMAFDWITGNLYYLQSERNYSVLIKMFYTKTKIQQTILHIDCNIDQEEDFNPYHPYGYLHEYDKDGNPEIRYRCPRTFDINPDHDQFFYMYEVNYHHESEICGRSADNKKLFDYQEHSILNIYMKYRNIVVDPDEERLYWIGNIGLWKIGSSKIDGSDVKYITGNEQLSAINNINVHHEWIYLNERLGIWRVDKKTGQIAQQIVPILNKDVKRQIFDMRIIRNSGQAKDSMKDP